MTTADPAELDLIPRIHSARFMYLNCILKISCPKVAVSISGPKNLETKVAPGIFVSKMTEAKVAEQNFRKRFCLLQRLQRRVVGRFA
jgi:hypothetical protein